MKDGALAVLRLSLGVLTYAAFWRHNVYAIIVLLVLSALAELAKGDN
jgi:hypothetical protein